MCDIDIKCCARMKLITTTRALKGQTDHANRRDKSSKRRLRDGADSGDNLHHLPWSPAPPGAPVDYKSAFEASCVARKLKRGTALAPSFTSLSLFARVD